jgi:lipopolysaccharide transport system ATP-binding protein
MFRINVQHINKFYNMYAHPHDRLLEVLLKRSRHKVFKALEGISFQVTMGKSLGIIGDNGAGKSTLLKLLAGTVRPTSGAIEVNGRVAALLELGAGFHPEFTGRQNIHLNASLLGISEQVIRKKEADIIAFAELENFIDQPVRTYSSGMHVRLAFSIATTVDPDILIIDEALAVGDMAFQRKCVRRMNGFRKQGKTMLFCSHSMYHIQELCDSAIWLEKGKIRKAGPCNQVVGMYQDFCENKKTAGSRSETVTQVDQVPEAEPVPEKDSRILSLTAASVHGKPLDMQQVDPKSPIVLEMTIKILSDRVSPNFGFAVMKDADEILGAVITGHDQVPCGPWAKGQIITVRYTMESIPFRFGSFLFLGAISDESGLLWYDKQYLGPFTVATEKGVGMVSIKGRWQILQS